jgi:hypothetical protein
MAYSAPKKASSNKNTRNKLHPTQTNQQQIPNKKSNNEGPQRKPPIDHSNYNYYSPLLLISYLELGDMNPWQIAAAAANSKKYEKREQAANR